MWGHTPLCRCGVCSTLKRICRHIADFSPKPGYVPFAADRLRCLAGELCDWGDSYCAGGAAPAPAQPPPQAGPGREVNEAVEKEAVHAKGEDSKASAAKGETAKAPKKEKEKAHRERRESRHRRERRDRSEVPPKHEVSEDSAFNSEEAALRTTAPKAACGVKAEVKEPVEEEEVEEFEKEDSEAAVPEGERTEENEREREEDLSPRSDSARDKKRSRRTRSRSRKRRRRQEESDRRQRGDSREDEREELERAREGQSSSAHPEVQPRPSRRPSRSIQRKPRSPDYPPPSKGRGRGRGWKGYPPADRGPRPEWTNKGVKKVGRQLEFKEFLAYKKRW